MGMPMGRNLLRAGFELTVWARRPESATEILAEGAVWAASPRELAERSDVVVLMVTNSPDVQQLVLDAGVLDGAAPGSVIVDMSTIAPAVSRSLAAACAARNVTFLDAPVSGGTQGAAAGTLTIMVGGEAEALERVRPVLDAMGARIFHVGPSGAGEVVKLETRGEGVAIERGAIDLRDLAQVRLVVAAPDRGAEDAEGHRDGHREAGDNQLLAAQLVLPAGAVLAIEEGAIIERHGSSGSVRWAGGRT